jgi:ubiquinone/menaquinone biosynthesis C-methylase UbiE
LERKINVGCGKDLRPGYINIDIHGGDVRGDLNRLPFKDGTVDEVYASHILEHMPDLNRTMREIRRVLRRGGILVARVPYGLRSLYIPFHVHAFDFTSFTVFACGDHPSLEVESLFRIRSQSITHYAVPFLSKYRWHIRRRAPLLWRFIGNDGGGIKIPFGRRGELTSILEKL